MIACEVEHSCLCKKKKENLKIIIILIISQKGIKWFLSLIFLKIIIDSLYEGKKMKL